MDYMNSGVALQLNKPTTRIDHSAADGHNKNAYERRDLQKNEKDEEEKELSAEEKLVSLSISLEGLQRMKIKESVETKDEELSEDEVEYLKKRMEGLSSMVVNGNFIMEDKLRFQTEIKFLADELVRINNGGISFTKGDNEEISGRIDSLSKEISQAAVRHRPASAYFTSNNHQKLAAAVNKLNIAI